MIALFAAGSLFCAGLREAVAQADKPSAPFASWKGARQPAKGELELFQSKRTLPPFSLCRVALAKDLSAMECELPVDSAQAAESQLASLIKDAGSCLGETWERKHSPMEHEVMVQRGLLGMASWDRRALNVMLYAQGPAAKDRFGFPLERVEKGAVLVLTVTAE